MLPKPGRRRFRWTVRAAVWLSLVLSFAPFLAPFSALAASGGAASPVPPGEDHLVVLVSLGGFRWDYAVKYGARTLLAMAAGGASAPEGMLPAYPADTAPNQYTLVTGLYPEHHGIVADRFYGEDRTRLFDSSDPAAVGDASWYGGTPLWVLAAGQGMRSGCVLWLGCEAAIGGVRPSLLFSEKEAPDTARVEEVLAWLRLPPAERPRFVALALAGAEEAGVRFGPGSAETRRAVLEADAAVGRLRRGIAALHLPVDLMVVSDHGMAETEGSPIYLQAYTDLGGISTAGALLYPGSEAAAGQAYEQLKIADARFAVYRRADLPKGLHANTSAREGDPVILALAPVRIRAQRPAAAEAPEPPEAGSHGYDSRLVPQMRAIFCAEGPDVRRGVRLQPFENIHLYLLIAEMLGLHPPQGDGSEGVLSPVLPASH